MQQGEEPLARETTQTAIEEPPRDRTMEAVRRLAGGVAHDFNNVLHVLRGNAASLADPANRPEATDERLRTIVRSVDRIALLVDRLTEIGDAERDEPTPTTIDDSIARLLPAIRRTLGERVELAIELGALGAVVVIDQNRLEHAIMNVIANARDALADGGTCTIATRRTSDDGVAIAVRDTGVGMDGHTQSGAFEPFFSTKPPAVGLGLGLTTALETITHAGGTMELASAPDVGTSVLIELPCREAS